MSMVRTVTITKSFITVRVWTGSCGFCKLTVDEINKNGVPAGKVIVIRPDHNSAGVQTSGHITIENDPSNCEHNNPELVKKNRERTEKEHSLRIKEG